VQSGCVADGWLQPGAIREYGRSSCNRMGNRMGKKSDAGGFPASYWHGITSRGGFADE